MQDDVKALDARRATPTPPPTCRGSLDADVLCRRMQDDVKALDARRATPLPTTTCRGSRDADVDAQADEPRDARVG